MLANINIIASMVHPGIANSWFLHYSLALYFFITTQCNHAKKLKKTLAEKSVDTAAAYRYGCVSHKLLT